MLGDGRPRHVEPGGDLPGRKLLPENHPEDLPAARLGDGVQDGFHDEDVAFTYTSCQAVEGPVLPGAPLAASGKL